MSRFFLIFHLSLSNRFCTISFKGSRICPSAFARIVGHVYNCSLDVFDVGPQSSSYCKESIRHLVGQSLEAVWFFFRWILTLCRTLGRWFRGLCLDRFWFVRSKISRMWCNHFRKPSTLMVVLPCQEQRRSGRGWCPQVSQEQAVTSMSTIFARPSRYAGRCGKRTNLVWSTERTLRCRNRTWLLKKTVYSRTVWTKKKKKKKISLKI